MGWNQIAKKQGFKCGICGKEPSTGRLCIDHEHAIGWKKMSAARRKLYVRGLLCWVCNHYIVGRGVTTEKLKAAVIYMNEYDLVKVARVFN